MVLKKTVHPNTYFFCLFGLLFFHAGAAASPTDTRAVGEAIYKPESKNPELSISNGPMSRRDVSNAGEVVIKNGERAYRTEGVAELRKSGALSVEGDDQGIRSAVADLDGDGRVEPFSDSVLFLRYLQGFDPSDSGWQGNIGPGSEFTKGAEIIDYVAQNEDELEIYDSGVLKDGLLLFRWLNGIRGLPLSNGIITNPYVILEGYWDRLAEVTGIGEDDWTLESKDWSSEELIPLKWAIRQSGTVYRVTPFTSTASGFSKHLMPSFNVRFFFNGKDILFNKIVFEPACLSYDSFASQSDRTDLDSNPETTQYITFLFFSYSGAERCNQDVFFEFDVAKGDSEITGFVSNIAPGYSVSEKLTIAVEVIDTDGDGLNDIEDVDDDNDGVNDTDDAFPADPDESEDTDEDGVGNNADDDDDGDGVPDEEDDLPLDSTEVSDNDGDGVGDIADWDDDNDGLTDEEESTLGTNPLVADSDEDGVNDLEDAFPLNPRESLDSDRDGLGNIVDTDDDNDGVRDSEDLFPLNPLESEDLDGDGIGDNTDLDDDGDGVPDTLDAFPRISSADYLDTDLDGLPDECPSACVTAGLEADSDDDNDGVPDSSDAFPLINTESKDSDGDGIGDNDEVRLAFIAQDYLNQRLVTYVGAASVNAFRSLDGLLDFGSSDDWTLARGSTLTYSGTCDDGGGVDISVTRTDFKKLEGTIEADGCEFNDLTINGKVSFEHDDEHWNQDVPLMTFPTVFTYSNIAISDTGGRTIRYSGRSSCDWRHNETARTFSQYVYEGEEIAGVSSGDVIYEEALGSAFDSDPDGSWQRESLLSNSLKETGVHWVPQDNCDFSDVSATFSGKSYQFDAIKYIQADDKPFYRFDTRTRLVRSDAEFELLFRFNLTKGIPLVAGSDQASDGEYLSNDDGSLMSAQAPYRGSYFFMADRASFTPSLGSGPSQYQLVIQQTTFEFVGLSKKSDLILGSNAFKSSTGLDKNVWLTVDIDGNGEPDSVSGYQTYTEYKNGRGCIDYLSRYERLVTFEAYSPDSKGTCQRSDGFYVDADGILFYKDSNLDGQNELFDIDDDDDGYVDRQDAFPNDANDWQDSDADGVGDNADIDDDNDGVADDQDIFPNDASESKDSDGDGLGDNADTDDDNDDVLDFLDRFPLDGTESKDNDADGIGDNADIDDDNDGLSDTREEELGTNPLSDDSDGDGVGDNTDALPLDSTETEDSDLDGVGDNSDAFPDDPEEQSDSDEDGVGDNADQFDDDPTEWLDTDGDGIGDNADPDDDNDGYSDEEELADGTNPLSRFSCRFGCFSFDIDENKEAKALTDGLLVIRHLFGFSGDSLTSGATTAEGARTSAEAISTYLADADSELDIDGDGQSKALTDGLLLIRYLFGFSGDSLIAGAIGEGAERATAEEIQAYIGDRVPSE